VLAGEEAMVTRGGRASLRSGLTWRDELLVPDWDELARLHLTSFAIQPSDRPHQTARAGMTDRGAMNDSFAHELNRLLPRGEGRRIARALGINESNVSGWRKGQHGISVEHAIALEELLDLEPGTLTVHLGFLPPTAAQLNILTPEAAIGADATLDTEAKRLMLDLLARLRRTSS
jgi:transcriptional regulator with XRE-family HTH domain